MKRIIALIMALALVMGLAITASAASISVELNAQDGANTSKITYRGIKIFDAEITDGGVVYSVPNDGSAFVTAILANLDKPKTQNGEDYYFRKSLSADGTKYYVNPTELAENEDAQILMNHIMFGINKDSVGFDMPYIENDGLYIKEDLDPGYYYVYSNVGSQNIIRTLGEDINITSKNEYPTVTKKVNGKDSVTVDEGNKVTFTVEIKMPTNNSNPGWYMTLHDTNEGVTIDEDSIKITCDGEGVANIEPVTNKDEWANCHEFDITWNYYVSGNTGKTIVVTYEATVNALTADATNTAWISLHPQFQPENPVYESVKDTVTMSNASVSIFKYTGDNQPLPDAGFVLAKKDANNNTLYYQFENGIVNWVADIADATEKLSGADGNVPAFEGLAEGTYTIIEKTVPAGYNKALDTEIKVETDDAGIAVDPQQVSVVNNTGSQLPSTGGIGTTLFYVIGGLMMTGAAVLLITKKRMAA